MRFRRKVGRGWLLLPVALIFVVDVVLRGDRLLGFPLKYVGSYAASLVQAGVFWGLLFYLSASARSWMRWPSRIAMAVLAMFAVGGQIYFFRQYAIYINIDATLFGTSMSDSVVGQVRADAGNMAWSMLPVLVVALALAASARYFIRPSRKPYRVASALLPLVLITWPAIPCSYRAMQASTPDVVYLHAMGGLAKALAGERTAEHIKPGLRTPMPVAPIHARARGNATPNVLLIVTESVRADAFCSTPREHCPITPRTNRLLPKRIGFEQLRSNSSATAIELAVLWSGLEPTSSREDLLSYPLLFEYARAAGFDSAYWTSHHMMFANSRLFVQGLPVSFQAGATDLDPLADMDLGAHDGLLTARALDQMDDLAEPFFAVVHYGNTHVPFRVDQDDQPFQPSLDSKAPESNDAYHNYYRNAVYAQDKTIAALIEGVRGRPRSARTVIVFTSDHGEAFREHGGLGHTGSVFDEEIHVPGFVDVPDGALDAEARASLAARASRLTFHLDITPTVLDMMGILDAPELDPFRGRWMGQSWLRPEAPRPIVKITNCAEIWGCVFQNWGVMQGSTKVFGREWENDWLCHDVLADPFEKHPRSDCDALEQQAAEIFGGVPMATRQ